MVEKKTKENKNNAMTDIFILLSLSVSVCTMSAAGDNRLKILCSSLLLELGRGQEFLFLDLRASRLIQNCRFSLPFLGEAVPA